MRPSKRTWAAAAISCVVAATFPAGTANAASGPRPASERGVSATRVAGLATLTGKKVLLLPYWLDDFGTAMTNWMVRDFKTYGISATIENPNAVPSAQITDLDTAISSGEYSGIVWQPIASQAAPSSVQRIEAAHIAEVVFGENPSLANTAVPQLKLGVSTDLYRPGQLAAEYLKNHSTLGTQPLIAWLGTDPPSQDCILRFNSLVAGARSVSPNAKVVFNGAAESGAEADSKMADFITRGIKFNVFDACGSTQSLGGISAMQAAGLAGAVDKAPQHVFVMSQDATPPELQLLWNKTSAEMVATLAPPKDAAQEAVNLMLPQLTGKLPIASHTTGVMDWIPILANCQTYRAEVLTQFYGVPGFKVPACSFTYSGQY